MPLNAGQIASLLNAPAREVKGNTLVRVGGEFGKITRMDVKPGERGKFDSKQGTKRRGRKGNVSIMPNGYARYCHNWDVEVIAYQA